jgi:hypothetical protein
MPLTIGSVARLRLAEFHGASDFLLEDEVGAARCVRHHLLLRDSSTGRLVQVQGIRLLLCAMAHSTSSGVEWVRGMRRAAISNVGVAMS